MDPRHLLQLATILEKGSITQASRHLHLTQPTLTHNMQTLEMQAGGRLFERSRLGVRSTPLGELLAREGRAIARGLKDAHEVSARHRLGMRDQVRLGTGPLIGAAVLPRVAVALRERQPGMALTLASDRPHLLVDQLIDGQHDLVIGPSWLEHPPEGIERTLLVPDTLGVFCGPSHPLAGKPQLAFGDANDQAWISLGVDSPFVRDALEMLADAGVDRARTEITAVGEAMMLLRILEEGRHLSVLPRFPVTLLRERFPLVELGLGLRPRPRKLYLWCRQASLDDPSLVAVKETILSIVQAGVAPQ
jgi:DNA-binding transcriptional LysR family regulator